MRTRSILLASVAVLLALSLLQVQAGDQEVKGQLKIGIHKVKLEKGKLYEVNLTRPARIPLNLAPESGRLVRASSDNAATDKYFFMPDKTGDHVFVASYSAFGFGFGVAPPDKDTIDYTVKFVGIALADQPLLSMKDQLTDTDPKIKNSDKYYKPYKIQMKAGRVYIIDLVKDGVRDPYVILEDAKGQTVGSDDDSGGDLNSRLIYVPREDGEYTILATTLAKETGGFNLTVRAGK